MHQPDGTPIWYELITHTPDAAQDFYARVMGWDFDKMAGSPAPDYRVFTTGDGAGVGGLMKAPEGADFAPLWTVYFGVADVDAMTERARSLGASVHMEPQDIPDVGRFSFVADPQGAPFYLMRGNSDAESTAFAPAKAGHCSWNELITSDPDAAMVFYGELFGWKKTGTMPMGERGDYAFFGKGEVEMYGAMMRSATNNEKPFWHMAFNVRDIDAARSAIEAGGGKVIHGPVELPGDRNEWLIRGEDHEGARVMFTGRRFKSGA